MSINVLSIDFLRFIKDPEKNSTLEDLNVISENQVEVIDINITDKMDLNNK